MQPKIEFLDFKLLKVDFSLNPNFKAEKKGTKNGYEFLVKHVLRKENKELVILLGVRQRGNAPYFFEVKGAGRFIFTRIPDAPLLKQMATINCPAMMFPYVRETIADLTRRAGFPPLHIAPINFVELAKQTAGDKEVKEEKLLPSR